MAAVTIKRGRTGSKSLKAAIDASDVLSSYAVAGLPAAASNTGKLVYCSNGATGTACLAYSNGTNWLRITLGAAVAAS
ncbi:MAG: hypothetical protein JWQ03_3013 [Variovorax sp.]|nr:hypothetical protein [Variovorax sp.]